jgi:vitamin B12/bleomycin/antimicrobial peptide transport system ATP-binding/permease protein
MAASDTKSDLAHLIRSRSRNLVQRLAWLAGAIHHSAARGQLYALGAGLVLVIVATVYMQIRLNAWNQPFYDAIRNRQFDMFLDQLRVFFELAAVLLVLNVTQAWFNQMIRLKLRETATLDLVRNWMSDKRASRIVRVGEIGLNPDQRIHEDTRHLTELTTDLGIGLLQSSLLLVSFIGVLWVLSRSLVFHFGEMSFSIPGYMVWAALLYAITGSLLSWRVGWPLVRLSADRYAHEADLRTALVRASEHADGIALSDGEDEARRSIEAEFEHVLAILRQTVFATVRLTSITAGYGWVALVIPIIVAAPAYFSGDLSFGELMMVVGAFNQVQQALRWFVDNTAGLADWRATAGRVIAFRQALFDLDFFDGHVNRIARGSHPAGLLAFDDLVIMNFRVQATLSEQHVEIRPGDRVLILGEPSTCKSTLFLSIAGLWNWGTGQIRVPATKSMMFLSQQPFIPSGSLRFILGHSLPENESAQIDFKSILNRVGLRHLAEALDRVARWDRELTNEELQQLIFARMLIVRPAWVISDEALDALNESGRELVSSIFSNEMKSAAVVSISSRANAGFYSRVIRLECQVMDLVPEVDRAAFTRA